MALSSQECEVVRALIVPQSVRVSAGGVSVYGGSMPTVSHSDAFGLDYGRAGVAGPGLIILDVVVPPRGLRPLVSHPSIARLGTSELYTLEPQITRGSNLALIYPDYLWLYSTPLS